MSDIGDLARQGEERSGLPARIEPVYGYKPESDIIPINIGLRSAPANDNLRAATIRIMEKLSNKFGKPPRYYTPRLLTDSPAYYAFLAEQLDKELGPAYSFAWIRNNVGDVPILDSPQSNPRYYNRLTNDARMLVEGLHATIFEHPKRRGLFVYQVVHIVHSGNPYKPLHERLFDAGVYPPVEQSVLEFRALPSENK